MTSLQKIGYRELALTKEDREKNYIKLIEIIIDKMRIATNQPALEPKLLNAMVIEWKDHFVQHRIKGGDLLEIYNEAITFRAKTDRRNTFCVEDMLGAWFRIRDKRANTPKTGKTAKDCSLCDKDGYIYTTRPDGRTIQISCNHEQI